MARHIVALVQFGIQWTARITDHLVHSPARWFEVRHTGDAVSRFQSIQGIQQTVTASW